MALWWLTKWEQSREIRQESATGLREPLSLSSIYHAFDPAYSAARESIAAILELTDSAGPTGILAAQLRPYFDEASACFPEIYDGCNFVQLLHVLENAGLIRWNRYRVAITPTGKALLKHPATTDAG
jgi:hypothetical protein